MKSLFSTKRLGRCTALALACAATGPLLPALATAATLAPPGLALASGNGSSSSTNTSTSSRVIVTLQPAAATAVRRAIAAAGGVIRRDMPRQDALAVELPGRALAALRHQAGVLSVEADAPRYPLALTRPSGAPYQKGQRVPYGVKLVQADQVPQSDEWAANRTVCIIDSGYDRRHEDLQGNHVTGEFDAGTGWWYADENHHGTHVAGTIAAYNNAGTGVVGVLPNGKVHLHIVKVFGADGWAYSSDLVAATDRCEDAGANVISMSLGGGTPTVAELKNFKRLAAKGLLSIAAAGNGGNGATTYPAGYASVLSVGAVDEFKKRAWFSQYNMDVELMAAGVLVLSTLPMGTGSEAVLQAGPAPYSPIGMYGSPVTQATGGLADFGLGKAEDAAMAGKVCLIARGEIPFVDKVRNCQSSGGVGAVIYNDVRGSFVGSVDDWAPLTIPSITVSDTEGATLKSQLGQDATVGVQVSNYGYLDGTSMATPAVSAVAALVWSHFPACTGEQIRTTLNLTAKDLGYPGRDREYGHGLVQARAAYDRLAIYGCGN